jgi:hypothetical protein
MDHNDSIKEWAKWYGADAAQEAKVRQLLAEATASDIDAISFAFQLETIAPPRPGYDRMMEARYLVNGLSNDDKNHPLFRRYYDLFVRNA